MLSKGEKSKHLCALAKTCLCRELRKLLQVLNWTMRWGKIRNPKYKVLVFLWSLLSFCCLSDEEGSRVQGWAKCLPGLLEWLNLRHLFRTGPWSLLFLFYTPLFWCSHNGDTFVFLSSVNQHPCRTEEVEGANLSKAGSRYPVILHWVFFSPFLYCMDLVRTVFI